jgi:hypothetical protein
LTKRFLLRDFHFRDLHNRDIDISEDSCRIINSNMEGTQQGSNLHRLALIKQFPDKGNILEDFS